eukprot:gene18266-20086_t
MFVPGIVQEILPAENGSRDVLPSTRSLLENQRLVHVNEIDDFDAVAKQDGKYVQQVRGYFKAPESGEYKFYSSCSGPCDIYIGQEESVNPRRIISQKEESLHNEFNRYPDQVSHTIYLEKDKLYFIQGNEQQNGGLGHLSVGVVLPNDKQVFPISKEYLRPVNVEDDFNRKEEVWRESKVDPSDPRDKMIKKLHEIKADIQNLTDEIERKSTEQIEEKNPNGDLEKLSTGQSSTKEDQLSKSVGIVEKSVEENRSNNVAGEESKKEDENKVERMRLNDNQMMVENPKMNSDGKQQNMLKKEQFGNDTNKESDGFLKETRKPEEALIGQASQEKVEQAKKEENMSPQIDDQGKFGKSGTLMSKEGGSVNKQRAGESIDGRLSSEKQSGESMQFQVDGNRQNQVWNADVQVEHASEVARDAKENGYSNMPSKPEDGTLIMQTDKAMGQSKERQEDDDVMQLTNYAKHEIAKNGNLSESVIRHLVKIIKEKVLSNGAFDKRQNMAQIKGASGDAVERSRGSKELEESAVVTGRKSEQKTPEVAGKRNGRIDIYNHVVNNLMKNLKKTLLPQKSKEKTQPILSGLSGAEDESNNIKSKFRIDNHSSEMLTSEEEKNNRIFASLNHLSSELEKIKSFLRTKDFPKQNGKEVSNSQQNYASSGPGKLIVAPQEMSVVSQKMNVAPQEMNVAPQEMNVAPKKMNVEVILDGSRTTKGEGHEEPSHGIGKELATVKQEKATGEQLVQTMQGDQTGSRKSMNPMQSNGVKKAVLMQDNANTNTYEGDTKAVTRYTQRSGAVRNGVLHETAEKDKAIQQRQYSSLPKVNPVDATGDIGDGLSAQLHADGVGGMNLASVYNGNNEQSITEKDLDRLLSEGGLAEALLNPNSYQSTIMNTITSVNNEDMVNSQSKMGFQSGAAELASARNDVAKQNATISKSAMADVGMMRDMSDGKVRDYNANSLIHQINSERILNKLKSSRSQMTTSSVDGMQEASSKLMPRQEARVQRNKVVERAKVPKPKNSSSMLKNTKTQIGNKKRKSKDVRVYKKMEITGNMKMKSRRLKGKVRKRTALI